MVRDQGEGIGTLNGHPTYPIMTVVLYFAFRLGTDQTDGRFMCETDPVACGKLSTVNDL
jgi:hypothetical protein